MKKAHKDILLNVVCLLAVFGASFLVGVYLFW